MFSCSKNIRTQWRSRSSGLLYPLYLEARWRRSLRGEIVLTSGLLVLTRLDFVLYFFVPALVALGRERRLDRKCGLDRAFTRLVSGSLRALVACRIRHVDARIECHQAAEGWMALQSDGLSDRRKRCYRPPSRHNALRARSRSPGMGRLEADVRPALLRAAGFLRYFLWSARDHVELAALALVLLSRLSVRPFITVRIGEALSDITGVKPKALTAAVRSRGFAARHDGALDPCCGEALLAARATFFPPQSSILEEANFLAGFEATHPGIYGIGDQAGDAVAAHALADRAYLRGPCHGPREMLELIGSRTPLLARSSPTIRSVITSRDGQPKAAADARRLQRPVVEPQQATLRHPSSQAGFRSRAATFCTAPLASFQSDGDAVPIETSVYDAAACLAETPWKTQGPRCDL